MCCNLQCFSDRTITVRKTLERAVINDIFSFRLAGLIVEINLGLTYIFQKHVGGWVVHPPAHPPSHRRSHFCFCYHVSRMILLRKLLIFYLSTKL